MTTNGSEERTVELAEDILKQALRNGARAVRLEPDARSLRIQNRLEGVLAPVQQLPLDVGHAVVTRLKILAGLDITERLRPQHGQFSIGHGTEATAFAVSTVPSIDGEAMVLVPQARPSPQALELTGFDVADLDRLRRVLGQRGGGMVLVAGPAGSGRHATVHAMLRHVAGAGGRAVVTAEWAVRTRIPGVRHATVSSDVGFAAFVRAYRQQDVDAVFVGEILDLDTAQEAARAALAGTLVLSLAHVFDAASVVNRLIDIGLDPWIVADTVSLVIGQRLIRRLCSRCCRREDPDSEALAQLETLGESIAGATLFGPVGCRECRETGFSGVMLAYEILEMTPDVASHLRRRRSLPQGTPARTTLAHAVSLARAGATSIAEALRGTGR